MHGVHTHFAELFIHFTRYCFDVAVACAGAYYEVVRDDGKFANIEQDYVFGLAVFSYFYYFVR